MGHRLKVSPAPGGWRAACTCGFRQRWATQAAAQYGAIMHERRVRRAA